MSQSVLETRSAPADVGAQGAGHAFDREDLAPARGIGLGFLLGAVALCGLLWALLS